MRAGLKILSLSVLSLVLCGFSSSLTVKVSQDLGGVPVFEISKNSTSRPGDGVEINVLLVVQKNASGEWDYKKPLWEFKLDPGSAKALSTVTYGSLPDGFTEVVKASSLVRGTHYLVACRGPGAGGSSEFIVR